MKYNINIQEDTNGEYLVTFPDAPEAVTTVEKLSELQDQAVDALISAFDFYIEDKKPIPVPQHIGVDYITLPVGLAAKVYLYNEWLASNLKKTDIASKIGVAPSNLDRLFNLHYRSKIEAIEQALATFDKHLDLKLV
ncbi:type II toxin-antitoxin system HicB family antitoxin [Caedibacter taeniospiralis]|uniref:type II toxin-antitoxin system HicB family antitoxin n=1 Tax=Caedibacter taeniospiralis TaxID=28907 RepID=UPI000C275C7D|nr:type II toxin-antitoxin system HicB family antitoxin [Caedibacter taeniospiralis]